MKPIRLREIEFGIAGGDRNETCFYVLGHIDPQAFLNIVVEDKSSDVPLDARQALTVDNVEHTRFRPMSPTEARSWGCDTGVMVAETGHRGYAVTRVML